MTLRVVTANLDWAAGGNAAYIRHLCEDADVLLVQEAKDVTLARVLPEGWTSLQDTRSQAQRGSAIAVRDATVAVRWHRLEVGALPFIHSRRVGLLTRFIAVAGLTEKATKRRATFISCHWPPARFRVLQPGMTRNVKRIVDNQRTAGWPIVLGTDANQSIAKVGRQLGLHAAGRGIVGILTDTELDGRPHIRAWGVKKGYTDHSSVTVRAILPNRKKTR